jgi:biopolymer transport protein ExbB
MIDLFQRGGPVMYLLLLCSVGALAITLERFWNLRRTKIIRMDSYETLHALLAGGQLNQAREYCRRHPGPFHNIIAAALDNFPYGREEVKEAVLDAGRQEIGFLERYLNALGTIAGIAPLLGLLGTMLGMIQVFQDIGLKGVGNAQNLADGISQALITTATGLPIAIFALVMYNYFSGVADRYVLEMEKHVFQLTRQMFRGRVGDETLDGLRADAVLARGQAAEQGGDGS